jgi:hypothetical protein
MDWFHETGGIIGTTVSAVFLIIMALVNLVILKSVWHAFNRLKNGKKINQDTDALLQGGMMSWIFRKHSTLYPEAGRCTWLVFYSVLALIQPQKLVSWVFLRRGHPVACLSGRSWYSRRYSQVEWR